MKLTTRSSVILFLSVCASRMAPTEALTNFLCRLFFHMPKIRPYTVDVPPLRLESSDYDGKVLIVGAGAAGMYAAYTLEYFGIDYEILEASSDFGGRVQELDNFLDVPIDLGAEWIHSKPKIRQDLLLYKDDEVEERVIKYRPRKISRYEDGRLRRMNFYRFCYEETKFWNTTWYSYLEEYLYPYIREHVEYNAVVEFIDYSSPGGVAVRTRDGRTFSADRVIVATPVTVLQQDDITFTPDLPATKKAEIDKVDMVAGLKVWVEFNERFYPDVTYDWAFDDKIFFDAVLGKPTSRFVLALFEVGKSAESLVVRNDNDIIADVLGELDEIFDGQATENYVQHYIQNWSAESYIKGAYSYNDNYNFDAILESVDGRLYFCGEYLDRGERSTVQGAALSGRHIAQQILLDAE